MAGHAWSGIAGLWRTDPGVGEGSGEAWTILTCPPGPDIAPYHHRQVVVLAPDAFAGWLSGEVAAEDVCRAPEAGTLVGERMQ